MKIKFNKKILLLSIITLLIIIIDQLIKTNIIYYNKILINGVLNITYVENTGGAFGIGNNSSLVIIIMNIIVIGLLMWSIINKKERIKTIEVILGALIIGGGLSNLADRILRGYVVDYLDINPLFKYPVFNFADACIVIGIIIFIIYVIRGELNERI